MTDAPLILSFRLTYRVYLNKPRCTQTTHGAEAGLRLFGFSWSQYKTRTRHGAGIAELYEKDRCLELDRQCMHCLVFKSKRATGSDALRSEA
jgi:hypothetical protein